VQKNAFEAWDFKLKSTLIKQEMINSNYLQHQCLSYIIKISNREHHDRLGKSRREIRLFSKNKINKIEITISIVELINFFNILQSTITTTISESRNAENSKYTNLALLDLEVLERS
jgi:hypothetical protein